MTQATIQSATSLPNGYGSLRLHAPILAVTAAPGHRVQLKTQCWPLINASAEQGWIELFYPHPEFAGLPQSTLTPGALIALGPLQGNAIDPNKLNLPAVLAADINGLASAMFLISRATTAVRRQCLVFIQSDHAFPFLPRPSLFMLPGAPPSTTGCVPLCEDLHIPSRLASTAGLPGCHEGSVAELLDGWLKLRGRGMVPQPHIYAFCGEELGGRLATIAANWGAHFADFR